MSIGNFEACLAVTAKWEGGWSFHDADRGGRTMYGITQATLGAFLGRPASVAEIRALTKERAKEIYRKLFWDAIGAEAMPKGVDLACWDWGVNSGAARGKRAYADVRTKFAKAHEMVKAVCKARYTFFNTIIAKDASQGVFKKGWFRRVAAIEATGFKWALAAQGMSPVDIQRQMGAEAAQAGQQAAKKDKQGTAAGGGAVATGGGGAAVASSWDWQTLIFCGLVVGAISFVAYMAFRAARIERARATAFMGAANA